MIVVNITDAKLQYLQSAIAVCALPVGASVPLRYNTKWVQQSILERVREGKTLPPLALFFLSGNRPGLREAREIPMRQASVKSAEIIGEYLVLEACVGEFYNESFIMACSNPGMLEGLLAFPKQGNFVFEDPGIVSRLASFGDATAEAWQFVVKHLGATSSLADAHFCLVEQIRDVGGDKVATFDSESLLLAANRHYEVLIHTVTSCSKVDSTPVATFALTQELGDVNDVPDFPMIRKYDQRTIGFSTRDPRRQAHGTLNLRSGVSLSPNIDIKAAIPGRWGVELLRRCLMGGGAALAGSSGVIPETVPIVVKVLLVVVGAFLIAFASAEAK